VKQRGGGLLPCCFLRARHFRRNLMTTRIRIDGMTCLNCVTHVEKSLEGVPEEKFLRAIQSAGDCHGKVVH